MENSLAPELPFLRNTMIPNLLEVVEKNAPLFPSLRLFDIGSTRTKQENYTERTFLTMVLVDERTSDRKADPFLRMKQDCETILAAYSDLESLLWAHSTYAWAHTNQQADMYS